MEQKQLVAIITARGGSKRIPRKNIRNFLGKPIIAYSIEASLKAECFDEVMVSTDDEEIAEIAGKYGAKVPFLRSEKNSDDYSTTYDVVEEVLLAYKKLGIAFEYGCCIYPTAPFVNSEKLIKGYDLLKSSTATSLIPVTEFGFPIQRSMKIEEDQLKMNWPEHMHTRSQDLQKSYHDCGQFYFFNTDAILEQKKIYTDKSIPMVIPSTEVQDIDNEVDWKLAEIKFSFLQQSHE